MAESSCESDDDSSTVCELLVNGGEVNVVLLRREVRSQDGNIIDGINMPPGVQDDVIQLNQSNVPEVVASEMVVTTTPGRKRKQNTKAIKRHMSNELTNCDTITAQSCQLWQLEHVQHSGVEETIDITETIVNAAQESYVAVIPESEVATMVSNHNEKTVKEITRRERDRIRKQENRRNPFVRESERAKARSRMKLKRLDPLYRNTERERDRVRRKLARMNNPAQREVERHADKERKRLQRGLHVELKSVFPEISATDEMGIETCAYILDPATGITTGISVEDVTK